MLLELSTFLVLRTCLQGVKLDEIDIFGGITLKDLGGNWLASWGERIAGNLTNQGKDALANLSKSLGGASAHLPANRDMQRAERLALGTALSAFHAALHAQDATFTADERHWVFCLGYTARILSDKREDCPAALEMHARWHAALQSSLSDTPLPDLVHAARSPVETQVAVVVHQAIGTWLHVEVIRDQKREATSVMPAIAAQWLADPLGFAFQPPDARKWLIKLVRRPPVGRPWLRMTVLQAWSQCFIEQLKTDERSFKAHMLQCMDDLKAVHPQITAQLDVAKARLDETLAAVLRIEDQLAHLLAITRSEFEAMTGTVKGSTDLLTALVDDVADQSKVWLSVQDQLHDIFVLLNEQHAPSFNHDPAQDAPMSQAQGAMVGLDQLVYRSRWLPHVLSRETEMDTLLAFLNSPAPFSIFVMVGEAGMGKSRLGLELVIRAREAGWRAGFLMSQCRLDETPHLEQWCPQVSTLLVVDYASEQGEGLASALSRMALNQTQFIGHLRILLLDRPESLSNHLNDSSISSPMGQDDNKRRSRQQFHSRQCQTEDLLPKDRAYDESSDAIHLSTLPLSVCEAFLRAVFTRAEQPDHELPQDWKHDVEKATAGGRPLMLTVLGLHYLRTDATPSDRASMDTLLDEIIAAEAEHRWLRVLRQHCQNRNGQPAEMLLPVLQRWISLAILCRGLDLKVHTKQVREALGTGSEDDRIIFSTIKQLLGTTTDSQGSKRLRPLEPDLLAERFLLRGGYCPPPFDELDDPAPLPFDALQMLPQACALDVGGVVQTLKLIRRDFKEKFSTYAIAVLPFISDKEGITDAEGNLLPHDQIRSHIVILWGMALIPTLRHIHKGEHTSPLLEALVGWSQKSTAAAYVSFYGARLGWDFLGPRVRPEIYAAWEDCVVRRIELPGVSLSEKHLSFELLAAGSFVNAIAHYGETKNWDKLESWGEHLISTASLHHDDIAFQVLLAQGAYNACRAYGSAQKWDKLELWEKRLVTVASLHADNSEIQLAFANGAFNAIGSYGESRNWDELEIWGNRLVNVASLHNSDPEIHHTLTQASFSAINSYGKILDWDKVEIWGERLVVVANLFSHHSEIQFQLAKAAVNSIEHYGSAKIWDSLKKWGDRLVTVGKLLPDHIEMQFFVAQGAVNAINSYGRAKKWDDLESWGAHIVTVAECHSGHTEIQLKLAEGAANAGSAYSRIRSWDQLERWANRLVSVAILHPDHLGIQLQVAKVAVNAIGDYGTSHEWEYLRLWENRLVGVITLHPQNPEIQIETVRAAVNAINTCGTGQRWTDQARWVAILQEALPESLESEKQSNVMHRAYSKLIQIQRRDQQPVLQELIALMEARYLSPRTSPPAATLIEIQNILVLYDQSSSKVQQQLKENLAESGLTIDMLRQVITDNVDQG